jgi:hypothetical protein
MPIAIDIMMIEMFDLFCVPQLNFSFVIVIEFEAEKSACVPHIILITREILNFACGQKNLLFFSFGDQFCKLLCLLKCDIIG